MSEEIRICKVGGHGLVFPLFESEQHLDNGLRAVLYTVALLYLFLGVSFVSDKFVASIEVITSKKKRVRQKRTGRVVTVTVWNGTVANLTLLALGSSAPEILLSLVETVSNGFHCGELGPSTIVGSAAFNLFMIIAVCISSIPLGETRVIKEQGVFVVTAIFSVFAYLWLVLICQILSPDVIEIWEGVATLAFLPVLILVAYLADIGYWSGGRKPALSRDRESFIDNYSAARDVDFGSSRRIAGGFMDEDALVPHWTTRTYDLDGTPLGNAAGNLGFPSETLELTGGLEEREFRVPVVREGGVMGRVACKYHMEGRTAVPGYDYLEDSGEIEFLAGQASAFIPVVVLPKRIGEHSDQFQIVLEEALGDATFDPCSDGGEERCILTVTIQNENEDFARHSIAVRASRWLDWALNIDSLRLAAKSWREEVVGSIRDVGDEDESPSAIDWFFHIISIPWKLAFSILVPPTTLTGGWPCFALSLVGIGLVTTWVIDFAELFGCVTGIPDSITAITIVALGTSMPDLFASRTSACQDEFADASIVNVTGSNSVNVFLGIGLPWTMSAVYWKITGATEDWKSRYSSYLSANPNGAFIVASGDLVFGVSVFTIAALIALTVIHVRRVKFGGELGGPAMPKMLSSLLLALLWVFYLGLSIWKIIVKSASAGMQVAAIAIAICILENVLLGLAFAAYLFRGKLASSPKVTDFADLEASSAFEEPPPIQAAPPPRTIRHSVAFSGVGASTYGARLKGSKHAFSFTSAAMVCFAAQRFKSLDKRFRTVREARPSLKRDSSFHSVDECIATNSTASVPHDGAAGAVSAALTANSLGTRVAGYVGNHAVDWVALSAAGLAAAQLVDTQGAAGLLRVGRS